MRELRVRKDIRLKNYDYSQVGCYFVTLCVKDRHELLGKVIVGTTALGRPFVELTSLGKCVDETIQIVGKNKAATVNNYVIMPNHIHMIVTLMDTTDDRGRSSLPQIVRNIKSYVTKQAGFSFWQHRFHDHIIRSEPEYRQIWQYIDENPARWHEDCYFEKILNHPLRILKETNKRS